MLKPFLKKYGWWYIPGMLFLFISVRIKTTIPDTLGDAIDLLADITHTTKDDVYAVALKLFLLAVGVFCAVFIWRTCVIGNGRRLERYLRTALFAKLQSFPSEFFECRRSGELLTYMVSDTGAVRQAFGSVLAIGVNASLTAVLSIVSMADEVDPRLTMFALLPVPVAVCCLVFLGKLVRRRSTRVQQMLSELSGFVNESIMGIKVIKTFAREDERHGEFDVISDDIRDANVKLVSASSLINPSVTVIFGLSYLISIIYGSELVMSGQITVGSLAAFLGYLALVQMPVIQLGRIINNVQRGMASYKRVKSIMDEPSVPESEFVASETVTGDIEFRDLTFSYPDSQQTALQNVSLTLKKGQTLGIAGTTGSGKTTILSLLLKIYDAPRGSIFIDGKDICDIPAADIRSGVGYVAQDGFLFSDTVTNNISFYSGKDAGQVERAAELAEIAADIMDFSKGYETAVGERGTRLSGGQKQRISLARALVRDPQLLLLDDTLSAVDNITEKKIIANLKRVLKGRTSIIVSHRLSAIKDCDFIIYMENGRIIEQGTHESLCAANGRYAAAYAEQSEVECDD